MNYLKRVLIATVLMVVAGIALAQPATNIDTIQIAPNANGDVSFNYLGDGTVTQITLRINFDSTNLTADLTNCGGSNATVSPGSVSCSIPGSDPNEIRIALLNLSSTPVGDGTFGSVNFTDLSGSPNVFPITFIDESYSDAGANAVPPVGSTEGAVEVTAPAGAGFYTSTPAPGATLDFGSAVVNNAAVPADVLNVANLSPDTAFDITAFSGPAVLTFPGVPQTIAAGANADQNITCTPTAVGANGGSFTVTHDAANGATSPVNYDFTCTGLAPNVQVAPTSLTLNGAIGGTPPTASFDVSNPDNGTASDAQNASVTDTGVSTEVSISDGLTDSVISVTETDSVTVSCSTAAFGTFNETITVAWDDPVNGGQATQDVTVTCNIANIAPGYTSAPTPGSTLAFGQVVNGQTSAAQTINIGNENSVGTGTQAELQITGAVLSDPTSFSFTPSSAFPITLPEMAPNGTASIDVTCGPDSIGTLTETLTVNTNDGDQVYDLTCEGTSNAALVATPNVIDGTFNLGSVPPTTTASNSITFSNSGSDPLNLTCTLTNNNAGVITSTALPSGTAIPPDFTITFDGTPPDINNFTETLNCDYDDPSTMASPDQTFTVDVAVSGRPLVIPTLSQWGLLLMMLSLLAVGGFAVRRMTA